MISLSLIFVLIPTEQNRTEQNRTDLIQKNYLELIKRHIEFSSILFSQFMIRSEQIKYCDC